MKKILIASIIFVAGFSKAKAQEIGQDKFYHFYYGSFASGVGSLIYINSSVKSPLKGRLLVSFGSAFVAGLGKELYDSRVGGSGFNVADLGATVLGAMPISLVFTLDKLDKNKKTKVKRKYRY